jgi:hypothetical protein
LFALFSMLSWDDDVFWVLIRQGIQDFVCGGMYDIWDARPEVFYA